MAFLKRHLWLIIVLGIGIVFRFYDIAHVPPGLWYDEACYAAKAMEFLNGNPELIYYQNGEAQFGLFPSLLAPGFLILGDTLLAPRSVMAILGSIGLVGCYLLSLELFKAHSQRKTIALVATFLLATSYWHLNFSRLIFSASLTPTVETFALLLTLLAFRTQRLAITFWAGVITAVGFYTYWQYYTFAACPALIALGYLWRNPKAYLRTFGVYAGVGAIALLPLLWGFFEYDMLDRLRSASAVPVSADVPLSFYEIASQYVMNGWLHLKMLYAGGDLNWRHNFSGQAQLAPLVFFGVCVALGCSLLLLKISHRNKNVVALLSVRLALALLFAWVFFALLPAALSAGGLPHASRAVGMVVPLHILAAFGLCTIWAWLKAWLDSRFAPSLSHHAGGALAIVLGLNLAMATARQYFVVFANDPDAKASFVIRDESLLRYNFAREAQW